MIDVIDNNGPYDFICLQEVSNSDEIIKESKILSSMNYNIHQSDSEQIGTFWNKKYHLVKNRNSEFRPGRPYQVLIFEENICLINLHMPHVNKIFFK